MAGFDLASLVSSALGLNATQAQQSQEIADLSLKGADIAEESATKTVQAGRLKAQAELVANQGKLQTQQDNIQAAQAFGTDVGAQSDLLTSLGITARETGVKLQAAQAKVSEIEAGSDLITNPMGWLRDLVQGDAARSELKALQGQFDTTVKTAQSLNIATQQTVNTQNAISETLTAASIKDNAEATVLAAEAEAANARLTGVKFGIEAVESLRRNGAEAFNRNLQVFNQVTEDARWQEGFAFRQAQFEQAKAAKRGIEDQNKYYADATGRINAYNERAGLPPVNEAQVRAQINQPGKIGDTLRDRETQGWRITEGGLGGAKLFGDTPSEVVERITRDNPSLPESFSPAIGVIQAGRKLADDQIKLATDDPVNGAALAKDKVAQGRMFDEAVATKAKSLQSDIRHGENNPYEAPPISSVMESSPALAKTNFGQKVLSTLQLAGNETPSPDVMMASAISAVEAGELSINEARDGITKFYSEATGLKNATGGFLQLGIPIQQGYRTKLNVFERGVRGAAIDFASSLSGGVLGTAIDLTQAADKEATKVLDLTKPTDVTLALTVMKTRKLQDEILARSAKQ